MEKETLKSKLCELIIMFAELGTDMCSIFIANLKDRCDEINKKAEEYKKLCNNDQRV